MLNLQSFLYYSVSVWPDLIDYYSHSITGSKSRASQKGVEVLCSLSCEASFWASFILLIDLLHLSNSSYFHFAQSFWFAVISDTAICVCRVGTKSEYLSALMSILVYVAKSVDWDIWHECLANSWDEWVSADRLLKHTEENLVKQKALDKKQGVEKGTKSGRSAQTKTRSSAGEFMLFSIQYVIKCFWVVKINVSYPHFCWLEFLNAYRRVLIQMAYRYCTYLAQRSACT